MILIIVAVLVFISTYLLVCQFKFIKSESEEARLPSHMLNDNSHMDFLSRKQNTSNPISKAWLPLTNRFKAYEHKIPIAGAIKKKLIKGGSPMGVFEFLAFKSLLLILIPMMGLIFFNASPRKDIVLLVSLAVGYVLPELWLNAKIKKRQSNIAKELPNVIDLLSLCVSGGLDFMLAVSRVVKDLRPCELTKELGEVYHQTQMGKTRREALKNFAWRIDMPETHSFVRTLVQADRMGTPMGEALKLQSEEMRVRRFQNGEAMALKAPIKLLFPLFAFILPVVMIIVGAPIIMQFLSNKGAMAF